MLTFLWLLSGVAFLMAVAAGARARRVSKRLERLSESYWELRYEHGQLRSRLARLEPATSGQDPAPGAGGEPPVGQPGATAFVPLSSLKR